MSPLVQGMIEASGTEEEIPLPNVRSAMLSKSIAYCTYHVDNPPKPIPRPLTTDNLGDHVDEFDAAFVDVDVEVLYELISAANYLDITSMLNLCCSKLASLMKGKKIEEVRQTLRIQNDYAPEVEARIREENMWCDPSQRRDTHQHSPDDESAGSSDA